MVRLGVGAADVGEPRPLPFTALSGARTPLAALATLCTLGLIAGLAGWVLRGPQAAAASLQPRPSPGCTGLAAPAGDRTIRVRVGGTVRTARLHLPRAALGHPAGLLLAFHGAGGTGRFMEGYSGLTQPLDAAGAIGLFPDAADGRWDLNEDAGDPASDLAFVAALLDAVQARYCVDTGRVWATGVSNGGGFTARLACVMADRLAAVAVVAGGYATLPDCRPVRPVSVLEIHGTGDSVVPYRGSSRTGRRGAVRPWLDAWAQRDGCRPTPGFRHVVRRVDAFTWSGCAAGVSVAQVRITGGGHQWPGATPPDPGPRFDFSAASAIWRFLSARRLP